MGGGNFEQGNFYKLQSQLCHVKESRNQIESLLRTKVGSGVEKTGVFLSIGRRPFLFA